MTGAERYINCLLLETYICVLTTQAVDLIEGVMKGQLVIDLGGN